MHFQYFEWIKDIVKTAIEDVFIVDPYLNEEVLIKFCVYAKTGVGIRLLGESYMSTLQPAAEALNKQRGGAVSLRKSSGLHDRYIFIDRSRCFISGASFKDDPQISASHLAEVIDAAAELLALPEAAWTKAAARL